MSSLQKQIVELKPHHIIKSSLVTEKTTHVAERYNCFVIEVSLFSDKLKIRQAVEEAWGVRVESVRTQMRVGKVRRHKGVLGVPRQKKIAFITLHADDRLNLI